MADTFELRRGEYVVSTDPTRLDVTAIHGFLTESYWAEGVTKDTVERSIEHSIPFGLYRQGKQVGFARVITDRQTLAYLADVYVEEAHRGRGLGKLLMEAVLGHPDLGRIRRWLLGTRDAHGLYRQYGFDALKKPERWMERAESPLYQHE
jgi:GNAT superfamily N-acetyltransferase